LTPLEQSLVEHVRRGEWLDLAADDQVDEAMMRSWDEDRNCRATVIRDILRGRLAPDPDPHGLRLRGARISGRLDLESLRTDINLELSDCLIEDGVLARNARLATVVLTGCQIGQWAVFAAAEAENRARVLDDLAAGRPLRTRDIAERIPVTVTEVGAAAAEPPLVPRQATFARSTMRRSRSS
jgi:hypothetical protein